MWQRSHCQQAPYSGQSSRTSSRSGRSSSPGLWSSLFGGWLRRLLGTPARAWGWWASAWSWFLLPPPRGSSSVSRPGRSSSELSGSWSSRWALSGGRRSGKGQWADVLTGLGVAFVVVALAVFVLLLVTPFGGGAPSSWNPYLLPLAGALGVILVSLGLYHRRAGGR